MNLMNLAPDIQEAILFLLAVEGGDRSGAGLGTQRRMWRSIAVS
jgi:hypothetical protein